MITWENYEEYMILLADGELSAEEERELLQFVANNPKLQAELAAYEGAHLVPDETVVFANKEELLKPLPKKKAVVLNQWWLYSAAACVLIGVFIFITQRPSTQNENNSVALDKPTNNAPKQQSLPQVDTSNRPVVAAQLQKTSTKLPVYHSTNNKTRTTVKEDIAQTDKQTIRGKEIITPIKAASNQPLAVAANTPLQKIHAVQATTKAIAKDTETNEKDNRLLAMVPIIQESKNNIMDIKDAVTDRVKQVQDIEKDMKDVNVVLHVGNREIAFNF